MSAPINDEDALRRYPELRELVTAREAGWVFRPIQDDGGELEGIVGSISRERYTDALWIYDRTTVIGVRVLDQEYGGGCVWQKEGGDLREVVQELLGLPEPGERGAPTLVKGSSLLWTPS